MPSTHHERSARPSPEYEKVVTFKSSPSHIAFHFQPFVQHRSLNFARPFRKSIFYDELLFR